MDNNIKKFLVAGLACAAVCATALAGHHGGAHHGGKPAAAPHRAPVHHQSNASVGGPRHMPPAPKMHNAAPKMHHVAHAAHHAHVRPPIHRHPAPPPPRHHVPCGFRYPRGHHIGGRHVVIVPPTVLINSYYWTEEVFINGQYFILYCYPDGTKRFADGTIYCYTTY